MGILISVAHKKKVSYLLKKAINKWRVQPHVSEYQVIELERVRGRLQEWPVLKWKCL